MCCAAIGLGLYGNDDLHNGLLEVLTAGQKVDNLVTTIRNQTHILENTLTNRIRPQLVELADIFDQAVSNQTALSKLFVSLNIVQGNVTLATNAASDIRRPLMGISMTHFLTVSRSSTFLQFMHPYPYPYPYPYPITSIHCVIAFISQFCTHSAAINGS